MAGARFKEEINDNERNIVLNHALLRLCNNRLMGNYLLTELLVNAQVYVYIILLL